MTKHTGVNSRRGTAGYSLVEMLIAVGITTIVMGATMKGVSDVSKGSQLVMNMTEMNNSLRTGMDLIERDMLQVGSGLPPGHVILIPSGNGATQIRLPGPPGTNFRSVVGDPDISAVNPQPGLGPTINGRATDVITVIMADNTFLDVGLTAVTATSVDIAAGVTIDTGPDRVTTGQLMMVWKGSTTALVQVTAVNYGARRLTFAALDSLNLNQPAAAAGNLAAVNATAPVNTPASTFITRVRMITYYLDATTDTRHPRLVRRINNGSPTTFDNTSGTAVAMDIENLVLRYDINDGANNPSNVEMNAADVAGTGACNPNPCNQNQIRKVDITLTARSYSLANAETHGYRNTLATQVSFRGMSFVDDYRGQF